MNDQKIIKILLLIIAVGIWVIAINQIRYEKRIKDVYVDGGNVEVSGSVEINQ